MITDLLRLGLRLCMVVALFVVGGTIISDVNERNHVIYAAAVPEFQFVPIPAPTYTVAEEALPPKPSFDLAEVVIPKPREVVITPTPTHSVIKRTAAPKRKPAPKPRVYSSSPSTAQAYARSLVSSGQFGCLVLLWTRESSWNVHAENTSSGAYGIPQALPGVKMATVGSDWRYNYKTQIKWGLGYISGRYGTPCAAWAHSNAFGWY